MSAHPHGLSRLLSVAEASAVLGVSPDTVRRRIESGDLAAFRDGRIIRVAESEVARYIAGRTPTPANPVAPSQRPRRSPARTRPRTASPSSGGGVLDPMARLRLLRAAREDPQ